MSRPDLTQLLLSILEQRHLMTVPQMLLALEKKSHKFNKTSVYRVLDKLLAEEKVCRQSLVDNDIYYELRTDHHDHLVCTSCGRVEAVECQLKKPEVKSTHHHLTLYGACTNCN